MGGDGDSASARIAGISTGDRDGGCGRGAGGTYPVWDIAARGEADFVGCVFAVTTMTDEGEVMVSPSNSSVPRGEAVPVVVGGSAELSGGEDAGYHRDRVDVNLSEGATDHELTAGAAAATTSASRHQGDHAVGGIKSSSTLKTAHEEAFVSFRVYMTDPFGACIRLERRMPQDLAQHHRILRCAPGACWAVVNASCCPSGASIATRSATCGDVATDGYACDSFKGAQAIATVGWSSMTALGGSGNAQPPLSLGGTPSVHLGKPLLGLRAWAEGREGKRAVRRERQRLVLLLAKTTRTSGLTLTAMGQPDIGSVIPPAAGSARMTSIPTEMLPKGTIKTDDFLSSEISVSSHTMRTVLRSVVGFVASFHLEGYFSATRRVGDGGDVSPDTTTVSTAERRGTGRVWVRVDTGEQVLSLQISSKVVLAQLLRATMLEATGASEKRAARPTEPTLIAATPAAAAAAAPAAEEAVGQERTHTNMESITTLDVAADTINAEVCLSHARAFLARWTLTPSLAVASPVMRSATTAAALHMQDPPPPEKKTGFPARTTLPEDKENIPSAAMVSGPGVPDVDNRRENHPSGGQDTIDDLAEALFRMAHLSRRGLGDVDTEGTSDSVFCERKTLQHRQDGARAAVSRIRVAGFERLSDENNKPSQGSTSGTEPGSGPSELSLGQPPPAHDNAVDTLSKPVGVDQRTLSGAFAVAGVLPLESKEQGVVAPTATINTIHSGVGSVGGIGEPVRDGGASVGTVGNEDIRCLDGTMYVRHGNNEESDTRTVDERIAVTSSPQADDVLKLLAVACRSKQQAFAVLFCSRGGRDGRGVSREEGPDDVGVVQSVSAVDSVRLAEELLNDLGCCPL